MKGESQCAVDFTSLDRLAFGRLLQLVTKQLLSRAGRLLEEQEIMSLGTLIYNSCLKLQ